MSRFGSRTAPFPHLTRFGRWRTLGSPQRNDSGKLMLHCICDCGRRQWVSQSNLVTGQSLSCGCLKRDRREEKKRATAYARANNLRVGNPMGGPDPWKGARAAKERLRAASQAEGSLRRRSRAAAAGSRS